MPLSPPAERVLRHERQVKINGYERQDGLWDIEAHLQDTKTSILDTVDGRQIPAGEPLHGMWLRLTIDTDLLIVAVDAAMDHTPYRHCSDIEPAFQKLVGERIGGGWRRMIREKLGGVQGCTHLVELLTPIATTAYQTLYEILHAKTGKVPLNGCHAWADDGEVVREYHPRFYRDPAQGPTTS